MSRLFGDAVHQAFVVPDFDKALATLSAAGIGPAFVLRRVRGPGRFRGERHDPLVSAAFAFSGDTAFEILTPHDDVPSTYLQFLKRRPQGGLHHVAYFSGDFAGAMAQAAAAGVPFEIVQEYIYPDSGEAYEVYIDPLGVDDPISVQLIRPGLLDSWFAEIRYIARDWDGSDPIRDALQLMPAEMRPVSEPE